MVPEIISEIARARAWVHSHRAAGRRVGFVPTMGALHAGHLSLMRRARAECDAVVSSVFVNPTQFGPNEDYERYPKDLERDAALAGSAGVDVIFAPSASVMYPPGACTWVEVEKLTEGLCGAHRPEHFRGVTTVVTKLFHIIPASVAYFGQKDFQQTMVIRRMVRDLDFDLSVVVCPTVREADGLAMSSRNAYLSADERRQAVCLYKALCRARELFAAGERAVDTLRGEMGAVIARMAPEAEVDYIEIVDAETLSRPAAADNKCVAALAVRVGRTRLIDNAALDSAE